MREITVRVKPNGQTVVDMTGFVGQGCDAVKSAIENALQQHVLTDDKKPEYFSQVLEEEEVRTRY